MFALILKIFEYIFPLSTLTALSAKVTDAKLGGFTQWLIQKFIATYNINIAECKNQDLKSYQTFNEFFVRKLKDDARPLALDANAVSPVDGTVGQAGDVLAGRLIQAKGLDYSLNALLGGRSEISQPFEGGNFACIYLSPANYHRIHMPLDGRLVKTIHIPGRHFPVGRRNVSYMPDLFTKNERFVCIFETSKGPFALVMVGAAMVGSIATPWEGTIIRRKDIEIKDYLDSKYSNLDQSQTSSFDFNFKRGDEIGMFKFGSTVICVWPKDIGELNETIKSDYAIRMGEPLIGESSFIRQEALPLQPTQEENKTDLETSEQKHEQNLESTATEQDISSLELSAESKENNTKRSAKDSSAETSKNTSN